MTVSSSPHNPSNSVIVRLRLFNEVGVLNRVTQKISDLGGNIGAIDIVRPEPDALIRTSPYLPTIRNMVKNWSRD